MKKDKRREKDVEIYLAKKLYKLGGLCFKWRAIDNKGVPDRVCMLPWMGIFLVEAKKRDGTTSRSQEFMFEKIKTAGGTVFVVQGHEGVDKLVEYALEFKAKMEA